MGDSPYLVTGPALISFSGGRTSGYMLKHIIDAHGGTLPDDVKVAFANTGKEAPAALDFVQECSDRWGVPITWLEYDPDEPHRTRIVNHNSASRMGEPFEAVIASRQMLPNPVMRFCTIEMKIRRFNMFCRHWLGWERWTSVVGLRADEPSRVAKQIARNETGKDRWHTVMPLAAAGATKEIIYEWWSRQPFDLRSPAVKNKTPAGNCDLCFLKGEATIRGLLRMNPELGEWWANAEANAVAKGTLNKPEMALFRADRPSYAQMMDDVSRQGDMFGDDDGESVDCACTD